MLSIHGLGDGNLKVVVQVLKILLGVQVELAIRHVG